MKQESLKFSGRASNPAAKKFSPAQIAAQKLFAERARAGTLKKGKRKAAVKRKANPTAKPIYFKTRGEAENVYLNYVDKNYPNKFQDARSISKIKIVEFDKGFAIQFGDYGDYLSRAQLIESRKPNPGLYDNINAKRARIRAGSGERMRKPGSKGAPTQEAFERSAMTAKQNPTTDVEIHLGGNKYGIIRTMGDGYGGQIFAAFYVQKLKTGLGDETETDLIATKNFKTRKGAIGYLVMQGRKTNPDKAKPRAYVKRVSQATGAPPSKRLMTRRKKALSAPAGYFPNPGTGMMTGYQVICMHPKKHVVGIFKTMGEAKQIATAMANANNVAYAVKTVKVHKAHFAA